MQLRKHIVKTRQTYKVNNSVTKQCGYMCLCWCSGRGSKRKAASDLNEETAPLDNKKEKTAVELKDEGQKVVIEHW